MFMYDTHKTHSNDAVLGSTILRLVELRDQEWKDFVMKLKMR